MKKNNLLIFPCSGYKMEGGYNWKESPSSLKELVSSETYKLILKARSQLLESLRLDKKYISGKYKKNKEIKDGPDFGGKEFSGRYLTAIERYSGTLYTKAVSNFAHLVRKSIEKPDGPQILILSALYGPLHPLDLIQNYNLQMCDRPAYIRWKKYFPFFMRDYVKSNKVKEINLYIGRSTCYFKVAKTSILPILKEEIIDKATQFEIKNGNTYHTPFNHGLLIIKHISTLEEDMRFTREIEPNDVKQPFI